MRLINTNLLNYFYKNGVKPLKDSLAKKFDASKLVNNLLTTASGFALDARQGPVIQRELDEINSKLSELIIVQNYSATLSVPANSVTTHDFNWVFPDGYSLAAVTLMCGSNVIMSEISSINVGRIKVRNFSENNVTNITVTAKVIFNNNLVLSQ